MHTDIYIPSAYHVLDHAYPNHTSASREQILPEMKPEKCMYSTYHNRPMSRDTMSNGERERRPSITCIPTGLATGEQRNQLNMPQSERMLEKKM